MWLFRSCVTHRTAHTTHRSTPPRPFPLCVSVGFFPINRAFRIILDIDHAIQSEKLSTNSKIRHVRGMLAASIVTTGIFSIYPPIGIPYVSPDLVTFIGKKQPGYKI